MSAEALFFGAYVFLMFVVLVAIVAEQEGVGLVLLLVAGVCAAVTISVGERAPSPSPGVPTATARADSEAAPARSLADGNGEDVVPVEGAEVAPPIRTTPQPEPASTVTQSALTATATVVIDPVPATPVATSRAVETLAPKSINSYDPWPAYLWPVVECLIQRESKGDPYAVGLAGERGLLQVHPITWSYLSRFGITPDALFDPATNIRAAYLLYIEAGGLRPWGGGCA